MISILLWAIPALAVLYAILVTVLPWEGKRKVRHVATYALGATGVVIALFPLVLVVSYLVARGAPGLDATFFTEVQKPLGEDGSGLLHAMLGSLMIVTMASCIGVPVGVLAGIYLAEIGKGWFADAVRFLAEVLTGLPSIIAGILGYALFVAPNQQQYSALAGAAALSVLMIPVVTRVTEESVRLVPRGLREASYGLGAGQFQTVWKVVIPSARSAILTGIVLAVARVGGETAPLLFTTAGQSVINWKPTEATAALPLSIYLNANQPFESSQQLAVTGALFLVMWIALVNVVMNWIAHRTRPKFG
jgi:phosphate transport system permease protein